MFHIDINTGNIEMHVGDTGAFKTHATRQSGTAWTNADRMVFTVRDGSGNVRLQRYYQLNTELGNGYAEIQLHNNDTDKWPSGNYNTERRYVVNPRWEDSSGDPHEAPAGNPVDALDSSIKIVDGDVVRVPDNGHATMTLLPVYGEV